MCKIARDCSRQKLGINEHGKKKTRKKKNYCCPKALLNAPLAFCSFNTLPQKGIIHDAHLHPIVSR